MLVNIRKCVFVKNVTSMISVSFTFGRNGDAGNRLEGTALGDGTIFNAHSFMKNIYQLLAILSVIFSFVLLIADVPVSPVPQGE